MEPFAFASAVPLYLLHSLLKNSNKKILAKIKKNLFSSSKAHCYRSVTLQSDLSAIAARRYERKLLIGRKLVKMLLLDLASYRFFQKMKLRQVQFRGSGVGGGGRMYEGSVSHMVTDCSTTSALE